VNRTRGMFNWTDFWGGLVLPAAATAGLLFIAWRVWRRKRSARESRSWGGPLATGAGFASGYLALFGWPGVAPPDVIDWLLLLALPLTALGLVDSWLRVPLPARVVLIALAVPSVLWLLARPLLAAGEPVASEASSQLLLFTAVSVSSLVMFDALAVRISAARLSGILLALAVPAAVAITLAGSLRYGQIALLLAATQAGAWAINIVLGRAAVGRGMILVFGTLLVGLLWCANQYAELETADALVLIAAPNAAWLAYLLPRRIGWLAQIVLQLLFVLGMAGVAVARAWMQSVSETPYY
jgi:hypothetical protein